jgi:hypothetical protein
MKSLSKLFYISSFLGCSIYLGVLAKTGEYYGADKEFVLVFGLVPLVFQIIVILHLTYSMWFSIRDDYARTTPGKAVGFLFIPIYNIYWMYHVLVGFVEDYNNFISRNELEVSVLKDDIFKAYFFLYIASIIPIVGEYIAAVNLIIGSMMIYKICDAVNALNSALLERVQGLSTESTK